MNLPDVDWKSKNWTIPGQIKKVLEEAGEVAEAIANRDWLEVVKESLDTMQTCKTLISMVLEQNLHDDENDYIFIDELLQQHAEKLAMKGYLKKDRSALDSVF